VSALYLVVMALSMRGFIDHPRSRRYNRWFNLRRFDNAMSVYKRMRSMQGAGDHTAGLCCACSLSSVSQFAGAYTSAQFYMSLPLSQFSIVPPVIRPCMVSALNNGAARFSCAYYFLPCYIQVHEPLSVVCIHREVHKRPLLSMI
jgi:hypothetical protein